MPAFPLLRAEQLRHHRAAQAETAAVTLDLRGEPLEFEPRSFTAIAGAAGSGAGLLLRLLGLRERPEAGEIFVAGMPTATLDDAARLELRNRAFGFVFAEPFLLEAFSVAENIAMPLFKISGLDLEQARQRTAELLDFAGLAEAADDPVEELSPLSQHKLALVRALANSPQVLIVEDPHLPMEERLEFFAGLQMAREACGLAVIAHAGEVEIPGADRVVRMSEGRIVEPAEPAPSAEEVRANE